MLASGPSSYAWSQADLEGLASSSGKDEQGTSTAPAPIPTNLSPSPWTSSSPSAQGLHRQWSRDVTPSSPWTSTQLSHSLSSSSSSSSAAQPWQRRTSTFVDESDPVVLSSSKRSTSLSRTASRSSSHWPPDDQHEKAVAASNHWTNSPTSATSADHWPPPPSAASNNPHHHHLYRSSSASSPTAVSGASPSRFQEYASSPRTLETMQEGVEHHTIHPSHHAHPASFQQQQQQHRIRASSSAAVLGYNGLHSPPGYGSRFTSWQLNEADERHHNGSRSASHSRHFNASGEGDATARQSPQSPADLRSGIATASNLSPFVRDTGFQNFHGTESRRHSIADAATATIPLPASGQQRRAVGFELAAGNDNEHGNRASDAPTPRYTQQTTTNTRPSAAAAPAFSEDDLAADLGQLHTELGKIQADQEHRDALAAGADRTRPGVNFRVPSSAAATTGAHAASMPPLFGDATKAKHFSESDWNAVLSPRSPGTESSSSPWQDCGSHLQHFHQQQQQQLHARQQQLGGGNSKSRSASVGPRPMTPPHVRSFGERGRSESVSNGIHHGLDQSDGRSLHQPPQQPPYPSRNGPESHAGGPMMPVSSSAAGPLNDFALTSLATLGPLPPNAGGGSGPSHDSSGAAGNLQELGRGVALAHLPNDTPLYIVGFKQGRTDLFFRALPPAGARSGDSASTSIRCDDLVIVEADRGKDLGRVVNDSLTVEQVRLFLAHTDAAASTLHPLGSRAANAARTINPKRLYSKATPTELSLLATKSLDEEKALDMCIQKVQQRGLTMHVLAAELQWDRRKLTFYYTAVSRVDFRALVAELFKIFKMRIWMCQIATPTTAATAQVAAAGMPSATVPATSTHPRQQPQQYHPVV